MKVLLAVDGSADTKKMLAYLTEHAGLLGTTPQYFVLNVQPAIPGHAAKVVGRETVNLYYSSEAEKVLRPIDKFLDRHGVDYTSSYGVGHAAEEILKAATKNKVDLIVEKFVYGTQHFFRFARMVDVDGFASHHFRRVARNCGLHVEHKIRWGGTK